MADVTGGGKTAGIFWIKDTSDEDQPMVFVPGVTKEGNLRTGPKVGFSGVRKGKMRMGNGIEVKGILGVGCQLQEKKNRFQRPCCPAKAPVKADRHSASSAGTVIRSPVLSPTKPTTIYVNSQALTKSAQARSSASLKDLCPEDKQRIANLIQELARVSEEKDETQQRLKEEQESFERKIQQLEEQNQLIVQEREGLQQQYRECQELLSLYQQYLSQQKEKLNHSIAHLSYSHSKASNSTGAIRPSARGGAPGLEGSYLGLPNVGAAKRGLARSTPPLTDDYQMATPPQLSSSSGRDSYPSEGRSQERGQRGGRSEAARGGASATEPRGPRRCLCAEERPSPAARPAARAPATAPPGGRVDWEERRNWLLLQKMELEVQREKLQAQLAQQEERLFQHNQKLRQSRMESSKIRDRVADHEPSTDRAAFSGTARSTETPRGAPDLGAVRAPSGESEDVDQIAAQEGEMVALPLQKPLQSYDAAAVSRRDAATSPAVVQSQLSAAPPSASGPAHPQTPSSQFSAVMLFLSTTPSASQTSPWGPPASSSSSLHSSLIELLDVFSPISAPVQRRGRPARKPRSPARKPPSSLLPPWAPPPRHSPTSTAEDPEESQILEDIFFIC